MNPGQGFQQQQGVQVGGDATFGDINFYNQKQPFTDLKADDLVSAYGHLISPAARQLIRRLADLRLLVLAPIELDRKAIALQLAAGHYSELHQAGNHNLKVRDWSADGGLIDLNALLEGPETKILILDGAGPNNLGVGLDRLARLLDERQHYAIITTDLDLDLWHVNSSECRYWVEPSWDTYYGKEFLSSLLQKELETALTSGLISGEDGAAVEPVRLLAGVEPDWIIAKLREPDRLFDFVKALQQEPAPFTAERIKTLTEEESGDRSKAIRWYRGQDERLQLLAVGLILFEGLPADQVFAGLETLVDGVWRPDKPALQGFDYLDVERLGRYFKRMQDAGEEGRIVVSAQREIFDAAWQLHRRSILAALPAMAEMLRNAGLGLEALDVDPEKVANNPTSKPPAAAPSGGPSASQGAGQAPPQGQGAQRSGGETADRNLVWSMSQGRARELYGNTRRMAGLQGAVVASLNRVGQISGSGFAAVEPCLRELAEGDSELVRLVVGRALAATRDWPSCPGEERPLFGTLHDWWRGACGDEVMPASSRRERSAMRATIALAVGHAANYDPANQMDERLGTLLLYILQDRWPEVRRAIRRVLPWIVAKHLRQLEEAAVVRATIAAQQDLLLAAALGAAGAYRLRPEETGEILAGWCRLARGPSGAVAAAKVTDQEMLMALTARALGALRTDDEDPIFPPKRIFAELSALLGVSRRPLVRRHVVIAVCEQALMSYEQGAALVTRLMGEVGLEDRSILLNVFVRAYLDQRQQLTGGDETLQLGETPYRVWVRQDRPLTQVEEAAYLWLQEWDQPVAQQVAAEIFAALAATTLERRERQLIAERRAAASGTRPVSSSSPVPVVQNSIRPLGVLGWMALLFSIRGKELRNALWAPFAELVWVSRQAPSTVGLANGAGLATPIAGGPDLTKHPVLATTADVLDRWRSAAEAESLKELITHLERALATYWWRWPLVLALFFLVMALLSMLQRLH